MSIVGSMDKQTAVYTYVGMLFNHKKKGSTDIYYNMDEPPNSILSKKSQTGHIWFCLYETPGTDKPLETEHKWGWQELRGKRE